MFTVKNYVYLTVSLLGQLIAATMFAVTVKAPKTLIKKLDSGQTEFLFTFRGRYSMDIVLSLLLFGMGPVGFLFATATIILPFIFRLLGARFKDAFNEVFRNPEYFDDETIESNVGGDYSQYEESAPQRRI